MAGRRRERRGRAGPGEGFTEAGGDKRRSTSNGEHSVGLVPNQTQSKKILTEIESNYLRRIEQKLTELKCFGSAT